MKKQPLIRKGKLKDLDQISHNNLSMAFETEKKSLETKRTRKGTEFVLRGKVDAEYYVVEIEGWKIAAQLMITKEWSDWRACYFWWLQSVYTVPEERGKGYYGLLYEYVLKKAKETGACGLRLYVDRKNVKAIKIYEKYGMKKNNYEMYEVEF